MNAESLPIKYIVEAALMAADKPMTVNQLVGLFDDAERPDGKLVRNALQELQIDCEGRGVELKEVASGFRYQAKQDYAPWLKKLWEERPPRYSKALMETLVLIAYRQPITRSEIEEIRGVAVNSQIIKTLAEREWIKVVGHREVPGKPALLGTTKLFLDYFNLKGLADLPTLDEIKDLDATGEALEKQLQLEQAFEGLTDKVKEDINDEDSSEENNDEEEKQSAEQVVESVEADAQECSVEEDVFRDENTDANKEND